MHDTDRFTARRAPRAGTSRLLLVALAGLLLGACAGNPPAAPLARGSATTGPAFCGDAQRFITGSRVVPVNVVYTDREAFVISKASARPLETRQFSTFEDEARKHPKMVSCKMKTADHIRTEYGADQAGADQSCASINQRSLEAVQASLTREERRRLKFGGRAARIVVEPDELVDNGGDWLKPFAIAWVDGQGALHLKAKGMNKGWLDPRYASAQTQFRGVRYCHLAAPEYLHRVLLGDAVP